MKTQLVSHLERCTQNILAQNTLPLSLNVGGPHPEEGAVGRVTRSWTVNSRVQTTALWCVSSKDTM